MRLLIEKNKNSGLFFFIILYRIILDYSYIQYVNPIWGYMDLELNISITKMILSYFLMFLVFFAMEKKYNYFSSMILQYLYLIMIVPILSYYALSDQSTYFLAACIICFLITIYLVKSLPNIKLIQIKQASVILNFWLPLILMIIVVLMIINYGIHFNVLDFSEIYDIREDQSSGILLGYLSIWAYRIICPILIIRTSLKKKYVSMLFFIFLQVLMYMCTPHKEILLAIPLLFIGVFFLKRHSFMKVFVVLLSIFLVLSIVSYQSLENITLLSLLAVRLLFVPASVKFEHFIYFSLHEKLYYSEGLIGKILGLHYPYGNLTSGNVIAMFFQGSISNSNTGYIAYGFDNLGLLGMIAISFLLAIILKYFDSISMRLNKNIVFAISLYAFSTLNDGDLLTALFSGGIGLLMILLLFYENEGNLYET